MHTNLSLHVLIAHNACMYIAVVHLHNETVPIIWTVTILASLTKTCYGEQSNVTFMICYQHLDENYIQDHTLHQRPHEHHHDHVVEQHTNGWTESLQGVVLDVVDNPSVEEDRGSLYVTLLSCLHSHHNQEYSSKHATTQHTVNVVMHVPQITCSRLDHIQILCIP